MRMVRLVCGLVLGSLAVTAVFAGGDKGADKKDEARAGTATAVAMKDNMFDMADITINVGESIRWENKGNNSHSATSDNIGDNGDTFNTGRVKPGQSSVINFNKAGDYKYHCVFHNGMKGVVHVK